MQIQNKFKILAGLLLSVSTVSSMEDQCPIKDAKQLFRIMTTVTNDQISFDGFEKNHKLLDGKVWKLEKEEPLSFTFEGHTQILHGCLLSQEILKSQQLAGDILKHVWKSDFQKGNLGEISCNKILSGWEIKYKLEEWKFDSSTNCRTFGVNQTTSYSNKISLTYKWGFWTPYTLTLTPAFKEKPDTDRF